MSKTRFAFRLAQSQHIQLTRGFGTQAADAQSGALCARLMEFLNKEQHVYAELRTALAQ